MLSFLKFFDPRLILPIALLAMIIIFSTGARAKKIAYAAIAAVLAAETLAMPLMNLMNHLKFGHLSFSLSVVQLILLIGVMVLLSLGKIHTLKSESHFSLQSLLLSVATAFFVAVNYIGFLTAAGRERLVTDSNLVAIFFGLRDLWLVVLLVMIFLVNILKRKDR